MRRKGLIRWVLGIPVLVAVLILIIIFYEPEKDGITRAMAAKSVALAVQSPEELKAWQKEYGASHFEARTLGQWYVGYLDYLYEHGYLDEDETPADEATAEGLLTYGEAARLTGQISPKLKSQIRVSKQNYNDPYPEDQWWLLYDSLIGAVDSADPVVKTTVMIYGTPGNVQEASAWTAYTNLGTLYFRGLVLDAYIDHKLEAYVRGNELIHVLADKGSDVVYSNVWLVDGHEDSLEVYLGDITRTIPFQKTSKKTGEMIHNLADIHLTDGEVTKVSIKRERITGKILAVNEDGIEIEGYGVLPLDDEYKILKVYGDLQRQQLKDLLVGYDLQEFVVAKGKICAALTVRRFEADVIRVLLMDSGYQRIYHPEVTMYCDGAVKLIQGEQEDTVAAGETLTFQAGDERLRSGRLILEPQAGCEITVRSMERTLGNPGYGGRLELVDTAEGLVLINQLYMEDYLKKVVPSEMPSEYEKEALKAQAVCARTYAYMQIQGNTYSQLGAHVDDSTNFQVYNNVETDSRAEAAVQETYGKMLLCEGQPISAYYYSTSCGTTTDAGVWGSEPEKTPYLRSVGLQPGRKDLELTSEKAFSSFIKNQDYPSYDSSYALYRWRVTTNSSILTENIGGVGTVTDIQVTERGAGGVAKTLLVTGSEGEKTITGQNSIRAALGDARLTLISKNGKESKDWRSLPSGFLTIEDGGMDNNGVQVFVIYGGGYGHGVGMSQNGAQGMAKAGMSYEDILKFFYDGVTVEEMGE